MTMRRTASSALIFSACAFAFAAPVLAQTPPAPPNVVVATGEHKIKVAPDQAWVTVSVETRDPKAPEARRLGAAAMTTVMAALKKTGLAADAIQTIGFSLQPEYEYVNNRQRMKGFILSNQVQVRIDDISKVADVLDSAGSLTLPASSMATVGGLRFDLKNRAGVQRDALKGAVEDAMARAKAMAAGGGVGLGRIVRIDETFGQIGPEPPRPMMMARQMAESVATPIEPGDIEVQARVTVTVEIK